MSLGQIRPIYYKYIYIKCACTVQELVSQKYLKAKVIVRTIALRCFWETGPSATRELLKGVCCLKFFQVVMVFSSFSFTANVGCTETQSVKSDV